MGLVLPELGEDTKERDDAVSILKLPLYVAAELRETESKPVMDSVAPLSTLIVPDPEPKVRVFVPVTVAVPSEARMDAPELKVAELTVSWTLPPTVVLVVPPLPATILPLNTPLLMVVVTFPPMRDVPGPEL
jgi:hypothetical protein